MPPESPTESPSMSPSNFPWMAPTTPPLLTAAPQPGLTSLPTTLPSTNPTIASSTAPSKSPSSMPSINLTYGSPSFLLSLAPSGTPTTKPSPKPSGSPSTKPSLTPSGNPSIQASSAPTSGPTVVPLEECSISESVWNLISMESASAVFNVPYHGSFPPGKAIDGNTGSFANSVEPPSYQSWSTLTVDIGFLATVGKVVVWNISDSCCSHRLYSAILRLLDENQNIIPGSPRTLTADIEQPLIFSGLTSVRFVQIEINAGVLNIAEVQVLSPSDENLITGSASASFNNPSSDGALAAELAIDGNTCGTSTCASTAHSVLIEPLNPALTIDLGCLTTVSKVTVWNRRDCCQRRTYGAVLELLDANGNVLSGRAK